MIDVMKRLADLDTVNPSRPEYKVSDDQHITTLSESAQVDECGMMPEMGDMGRPSTPASINMTAASGDELGELIKAIATLAGQNRPTEMEPLSAMPTMGVASDDGMDMRAMIDKLNPMGDDQPEEGLIGRGVGGMAGGALGSTAGKALGTMAGGPIGGAIGGVAGDLIGTSIGAEMGDDDDEKNETYDNTPNDPTDTNEFDAEQHAHHENPPGAAKGRGNMNNPRAVPTMEEIEQNLFADYKKFISEAGVEEGSSPNKTEIAMAYLMAIVMAPTGTPENERISNWQEVLDYKFDIEIDTATLAQMLPQLDSQLKSGKLDKLQNRMASRGELEIGENQQGAAEGSDDLRSDVLLVIQDIYNGAQAGEDMIDTVADELGDYFQDVKRSKDKTLRKAYQFMRREGAEAEDDPEMMAQVAKQAIDMLGQQDATEGGASMPGDQYLSIPADQTKLSIGQQMARDGITYSPDKEDELIGLISQYMKKAGMSSKQIRYLLNYDEDYISDQLSDLPKKGTEEGIEDRLKDLDPKNPVNIPAYQRKAASGDSASAARNTKESANESMTDILKLSGLK